MVIVNAFPVPARVASSAWVSVAAIVAVIVPVVRRSIALTWSTVTVASERVTLVAPNPVMAVPAALAVRAARTSAFVPVSSIPASRHASK